MILCCGEALIDMLPREMRDGGEGFLPVPGGAIFNTALALGRLELEVSFYSSVSTDMFGDQLIFALHKSNVKTDLSVRSPQPTTLAFVKLKDGQAEYSFFDENSAGRSLQVSQLPDLSSGISTLHFGAISLIPEPCGSAYESFMAANQHKVLSLDPNIRPGFIEHEPHHRERIERMIAMADIVKVSNEDLDWIGNGKSYDDVVTPWLNGATSIVLVTDGAEGVRAYTQFGSVREPALKAKVVDTIGAGDTFNAGFLAGLKQSGLLSKSALDKLNPQDLRMALKLAVKVAAHTVAKAGANPPWKSEL
jgi:fructokinase